MTSAINAIQFDFLQYENGFIEKENSQEKAPTKEVIYSQTKNISSKEGSSWNISMTQQGRSVFDMIRSSFFTQRGISISSISKVANTSSEKIKSVASEMLSLQEELSNLISTTDKLTGASSSDEYIKEYQAKYIELYNKLADKKAEFDKYVNSSNLTDAKIRELCKDAYSKNENNNNNILNRITELNNKRQEITRKMSATSSESSSDSLENEQLQALDQVYMLEQEKLQQQYAISGLDLLSSNTKFEKLSTDKTSLLTQFMEIKEERELLAYQISATSGTTNTNTKELEEKDLELAKKQQEIAKQLDTQNNNYDSVGYSLLFAPESLSLSMQKSDIEYKISNIISKKDEIASQIVELSKTNPNSEEMSQLRAIYQVYGLEHASLKKQADSLSNKSSIQKDVENISILTEKDYKLLKISNERQLIAYQLAALEEGDGDANLIAELKEKDAELAKQQKDLK